MTGGGSAGVGTRGNAAVGRPPNHATDANIDPVHQRY